MRLPQVTWSTIGQASPHQLGAERRYVWNGNPAKSEAVEAGTARTPGPLQGSPSMRAKEKAERFAKFCKLRDEGMDVIPAGREVGVERRAAARYEKERKTAKEAADA